MHKFFFPSLHRDAKGVVTACALATYLHVAASVVCAQERHHGSHATDSTDAAVVTLPEVTVVATRSPIAAIDAPGMVVVIGQNGTGRSLAQALQQSGGVHIRSYGPAGLATVALRGSGSAQTSLYLDGFQLANAQLGQFDLGLLPSSFLSRVEVMSGASSALYGSDAVGGVISASSVTVADVRPTLSAGVGAFGERTIDVAAGTTVGRFGFAGALRLASADGDFAFTNRALFPVTSTRRSNADRNDLVGLVDLEFDGRRANLHAHVLAVDTRRGLPGVAGTVPSSDRQDDILIRATTGLSFAVAETDITVGTLIERNTLRYQSQLLTLDQTGTVSRMGVRVVARPEEIRRRSSTVAAELDWSRADHPALADQPSRLNLSLSGSSAVARRGTSIYPALRLDLFDFAGQRRAMVLSPRLGVTRRMSASRPVSLKISGGRSFRMPTFNDLYWRAAGAAGNVDLRPERSWSADFGSGWFGSVFSGELALFGRWTRNEISWSPGSDSRWTPKNIGFVRAYGLQMQTRTQVSVGRFTISGDAGYTLTHARSLVDEGQRYLRYNPAHVGSLSLSIGSRRLFSEFDLHGSGRRFVTSDGKETLPAYFVAAVRFGIRVESKRALMTARLSVENSTNNEYAVVKGYPMPPRHLRLEITTTLR